MSGELVDKGGRPPAEFALDEVLDPRAARSVRQRFRYFLFNNLADIEREMLWLMKNGTEAHRTRVSLMCKILDKLVPNQTDGQQPGGSNAVPQIIIQNVQRGTVEPKVLEAEVSDA